MRTSGMRFQPSARMQPLRVRPTAGADSREIWKPVKMPLPDDVVALRGHALVVVAEAAERAWDGRVGVTVTCSEP